LPEYCDPTVNLQRITYVKLSHVTALTLLFGMCVLGVHAHDANETSHKPSNVLFSAALQDVPGKQLVVVGLEFKPKGQQASVPHRHPGSVYVYVTRGTARLAIEGQPIQEVHTGQSFFEPPGGLHTVAESASETESAAAIAVLIVPNGAPLLTVEPRK
jgi:quercetin dioxygenase-like cupin family protein